MSSLPPNTALGWAQLRAVLEADGALSADEKALITAAVAAVRGRERLLATELERLGGRRDGALGALAATLALSRSREVADRFAAAAGIELAWEAGETGVDAAPDPAAVDAAREFFTAPGAAAAPAIALLADHAPSYLLGYRALREGVYGGEALEPRLAELALFAISAGDVVAGHSAVHAARAADRGADEAQLVEAGLCAVAAAGMAAWLVAAEAIAASRPAPDRAPADPPAGLERLLAEAEIREVVARYCQGVDSRDYDRVRECYHPDARHERGDFSGSGEEIVTWIASIRETLVHCWHLVGYPRIEWRAAEEAEVETHTLANQRMARADGPAVDRLTPCRYRDTFTKVDGRWRIALRRALYLPAQELPVDPGVESPDSFAGADPTDRSASS